MKRINQDSGAYGQEVGGKSRGSGSGNPSHPGTAGPGQHLGAAGVVSTHQ